MNPNYPHKGDQAMPLSYKALGNFNKDIIYKYPIKWGTWFVDDYEHGMFKEREREEKIDLNQSVVL